MAIRSLSKLVIVASTSLFNQIPKDHVFTVFLLLDKPFWVQLVPFSVRMFANTGIVKK
jgi:hypothetical protein